MATKFNKKIQYKTINPNIDDYWVLFNSTGWNTTYNFIKQDLYTAINNSWYTVSAYYNDKLVGYGRIISDGIHHALIVDLIILPNFQNLGIGGEILTNLLKKCLSSNIRDIQLFSANDKYKFYKKYGFEKRRINAPGMEYKQE